jgi:hypothetical protein
MSKAQNIIIRLTELSSFIDEAQTKLDNGEIVNLTHLDDEVSTLCEETLSLPPQEAVQVQAVMAEMISKLEKLSVALQEFQDNLKSGNGMH